jgi:hypothetical protein
VGAALRAAIRLNLKKSPLGGQRPHDRLPHQKSFPREPDNPESHDIARISMICYYRFGSDAPRFMKTIVEF